MESGGNRNQYWVLRSVTKDLNLALVYAIFKFYQTRTPMVGLPRGLGDKLDMITSNFCAQHPCKRKSHVKSSSSTKTAGYMIRE